MLRYLPDEVACVLDSTCVGRNLAELLGFGGNVPIVATAEEALRLKPTALLIGVAAAGGRLPLIWEDAIFAFLRNGLSVISGLHYFLGDDPRFSVIARECKGQIIDLRRPPLERNIASARALAHSGIRVLTVGTDECMGKMTAALEVTAEANRRGWDGKFIATGQTGIAIEGDGVVIDAVIADFMAGAVETLVLNNRHRRLLVIEGQGAITSPSFSGVTLGILHGCLPQALILCHDMRRSYHRGTVFRLPDPQMVMSLYENLARALAPCVTIGVCLNTSGQSQEMAMRDLHAIEAKLGVPATDPIRFGVSRLLDAVEPFMRTL